MIRSLLTLALTAAAAAPLAAQTDKMAPHGQGEATVYRDVGFRGPALYVGRAQPNLDLPWPVRSVRVKSGYWQLCSQRNFAGRCTVVSADESDLRGRTGFFDRVQSMRPLGGPQIQPPRPPIGPAPVAGDATPGTVGSAFYPAPGRNGIRILACASGPASANCARQTAERFCRDQGYLRAAYSSMQSLVGRAWLADVLCVRSAV